MRDLAPIALVLVMVIFMGIGFVSCYHTGYNNAVRDIQKKEREMYQHKLDSVIINHLQHK